MPKQIWDLKPGDKVGTVDYGEVEFIGFIEEGLECKVILGKDLAIRCGYGDRFVGAIIPTSDLVLEQNAPEALQQNNPPLSRQLEHE